MQTKKAVTALRPLPNDMKLSAIQSPELQERAAEYLEQYEARERSILARKNRDLVNTPVLDVLRRKVAKVSGEADLATPVAMRFYVYTAMKSAAEQMPRDRGVSTAAHVLEALWRNEPMGSLTLGQVTDLRTKMKDNYPRSKVAKVLDTVVSRVGYSKLPVVKLVRLAQQIETQEDFDTLIKAAGFDGDRPEHIKARTLVRELVAMRGGAPLHSEDMKDDRTTFERVTDRVAKEAQMFPVDEPALEPNVPGDSMGMDDIAPGDDSMLPPEAEPALATPGQEQDAVDEVIPMIEEVDQIVEDTMPPAAEPYVEEEVAEGGALPGTAEWGFNEAEEGHTAPPPSEAWQAEELAEHGVDGVSDGMSSDEGLHGEMPMGDAPIMEEPGMGDPAEHGLSGKLAHKRMQIQAAMGTRTAQHGPVPYQDPFEMSPHEGKTIEDLEAAVKAGAMSKSEYLQARRVLEHKDMMLGKQQRDPQGPEHPLSGRPMRQVGKTAEGLDAPKPPSDGQYGGRRNNDAPDRGKDGGAELTKDESIGVGEKKALTAVEIEAALIDRGEEIRYGSAVLRINESDEVEFWHKGAGRACSLVDINIAIHDFIKAAHAEYKQHTTPPTTRQIKLVPVPCGKCGKAEMFEFTAAKDDLYACGECGHRTKATLVADMVKRGLLSLTEETVRVAQFDAGSIAAPGSADQALPQEVAPQGAAAPTPAPQKPGASDAALPGASAPGTITAEDIAAAFRHYKAMELPFPEAMAQFAKDYKEKIEAGWQSPAMDVQLIDIARQLYSSSGPAMTQQQVMQARVAWNLAKKAFNTPKPVAQHPDHVKVEKFPGAPNSDEKDMGRLQAPKPKANGKQPGAGSQSGTKAPPKDMGKTNEDKHPAGLDAPKPPADGHVKGKAGDQPGTAAVPDKELGKDSDHNGKDVPLPGKFGPRPKIGSKAPSASKPSASKPSASKSSK